MWNENITRRQGEITVNNVQTATWSADELKHQTEIKTKSAFPRRACGTRKNHPEEHVE